MKSSKVTRLSEKLEALQLLLFSLNYTKQCIYNFQVFLYVYYKLQKVQPHFNES